MLINQIKTERPPLDNYIIEKIINRYCDKQKSLSRKSEAYFSQLWQGYAWAAIIGFNNDKRSKLSGKKDTKFTMGVISNQNNDIFNTLILLGISHSEKGFEIVNHPKEIVEIISEYAKGGAEYIQDIIDTETINLTFKSPDDFLDEIIER